MVIFSIQKTNRKQVFTSYSNLQFYFQYSHNLLHTALTKFKPQQLDTRVLHSHTERPDYIDCESYRELKCGQINFIWLKNKSTCHFCDHSWSFSVTSGWDPHDTVGLKQQKTEVTGINSIFNHCGVGSSSLRFFTEKNVFRANKNKFRISMVPCSFILPSSRQAKYRCCTLKTYTHTLTARQFLQAEGLLPSTAPVGST